MKDKNLAQLQQKLQELRKEAAGIKLQLSLNRLKDYTKIKKNRKEVARVLTTINQKRREELYG